MKNTENGSLDDDNLSDNSVDDDSWGDGNTDNVKNTKQTLVLVDLKEGETLNSLDDLHLLRTIGAFYSNFGPNITVIPISELTQFSQKFTEPVLFNDAYIVGHGVYSSLGSKLSVEDCANYFKDSLSNQNFNVDHIHLTVCHSAERRTKEEDKDKESLLFTVHKKLHELDKKSIQITGYKNQIHLIRTDSLKCGQFKMNLIMPYASIIHEGLQELRKKNDCTTHTDGVFNDLMYFTNKYLYGIDPQPPKKTGPIYELLNQYVTQLNSKGMNSEDYKILFDNLAILQNQTSKIDKFIKNNKIILYEDTILTNETKKLNLQQLIDLYNYLKDNKDKMSENDFNVQFNQMYWAYNSIK